MELYKYTGSVAVLTVRFGEAERMFITLRVELFFPSPYGFFSDPALSFKRLLSIPVIPAFFQKAADAFGTR